MAVRKSCWKSWTKSCLKINFNQVFVCIRSNLSVVLKSPIKYLSVKPHLRYTQGTIIFFRLKCTFHPICFKKLRFWPPLKKRIFLLEQNVFNITLKSFDDNKVLKNCQLDMLIFVQVYRTIEFFIDH